MIPYGDRHRRWHATRRGGLAPRWIGCDRRRRGRRGQSLLRRVLRPVRAARGVLVLPVLVLPQVLRRPCGDDRDDSRRRRLRALVRAGHVRPAPPGKQDDGGVPGHVPKELCGGPMQAAEQYQCEFGHVSPNR